MHCHDCHAEGRTTEAVGLCHHCSVALCPAHGSLIADPILVHEPIIKTIALPKQARAFLCRTCLDALRQRERLVEEAHP